MQWVMEAYREVRETDTRVSLGPAGVPMLIDTQSTEMDKNSETHRERWRDRQRGREIDREAVGDTHTAEDGKRGLRRERQGVRDREMNTEVQRQGDAE